MFGLTAHRVGATNNELAGFFGHTHLPVFSQVQRNLATLNQDQTAVIQAFTASFLGCDGLTFLLGNLEFSLDPIALLSDEFSNTLRARD